MLRSSAFNLHALEILKSTAYDTAVLRLNGLLHGFLGALRRQHDLRILADGSKQTKRQTSLFTREQNLVRSSQLQATRVKNSKDKT